MPKSNGTLKPLNFSNLDIQNFARRTATQTHLPVLGEEQKTSNPIGKRDRARSLLKIEILLYTSWKVNFEVFKMEKRLESLSSPNVKFDREKNRKIAIFF